MLEITEEEGEEIGLLDKTVEVVMMQDRGLSASPLIFYYHGTEMIILSSIIIDPLLS